MVPYPFSRGVFVYGDLIDVPREADDALVEAKRSELERALNEACERAERSVEA